jgi:DNA repair protein RadC
MIEQFKIMLLNRANKILGIFTVSTGGVAGTVADPEVICYSVERKCKFNYISTQPSIRKFEASFADEGLI